MLLLIPAVMGKTKATLTKGTIADDINAFFYIDSKFKAYKLSTTTLSIDFVLKRGDYVYIKFNYAGRKWWYVKKLSKIS